MLKPLCYYVRRLLDRPLGRWIVSALAGALLAVPAAGSNWKDRVGHTSLAQRVPLVSGAGISVRQLESSDDDGGYLPDPNWSIFQGKTFTDLTGVGIYGWHATYIGLYMYGSGSSIAPGLDSIAVMQSQDFLVNSLRYSNKTALPEDISGYDLQTVSWAQGGVGLPSLERARAKFDRQLADGGVLGLSGTANVEQRSGTWFGFSVPTIMGESYNAVVLGGSDGWTAPGPASTGAIRPDLVAPGYWNGTGEHDKTSWSMARTASGMALLMAESRARGWIDGDDPRVIRAAGMAGAIKLGERYDVVIDSSGTTGTINAWAKGDPDTTADDASRPLDFYQGAGQFNVENAWDMLSFGKQAHSSDVLPMGYDLASVPAAGSNAYYFDVHTDATSLSVILNWWADVWTQGSGEDTEWITTVDNLDLRLYEVQADGQTLGAEVQASLSTLDNIEHIWLEDLLAGRYALVVEGADRTVEYALAWQALDAMIAGDANNDGWIDQTDLLAWQAGYDTVGTDAHTWLDGDWNRDGLVNGADLALWQQNYTAPAGGSAPSVPEPTALALLAGGAGALLRRRRRSHTSR